MAEYLVSTNLRDKPPQYYKSKIHEFLETKCLFQIEDLLLSTSGPFEHISLLISYYKIAQFDSTLAFYIVHYPKILIPFLDETIIDLQREILQSTFFREKYGPLRGSLKKFCHGRIIELPPLVELSKSTINDVNASDMSSTDASFVQFCGTIVRTGGVRMLEVSKQYECQNPKCRYKFTIEADPEQGNMLPQPRVCPSRPQPGKKACNCSELKEVDGSKVCIDYQEVKVQDKIDRLALGVIPRSIILIVEGDLVDKYNPGDDIIIVGIVLRQWKALIKSVRCTIELAIRVHSIVPMNYNEKLYSIINDASGKFERFWDFHKSRKSFFVGRDTIVRSICPQLYGMYYVKLCLLMTLVGGSSANTQDNGSKVRRRHQSHMLLVGDPGCGKSQLLRFAANVSRRSVLTTGIGTTGVGLTCAMVKDGPDWAIEAGALVLADHGCCCIDEFASIKEHDRATIHEAMEQQTLSIAKAGMVVKLNTRCNVIACCNPKGSYDITQDISTNTAIATPLLSRFDIVLILLDTPQKEWDKRVSTFLLQQAVQELHQSNQTSTIADDHLKDISSPWDISILTQYISYVKSNYHPEMSLEAKSILIKFYQQQRQDFRNASSGRTTVRLLESLKRLSEAHAKILCKNSVDLTDAIVAIYCILLSQFDTSILEVNKTLQSDFPENPNDEYIRQEEKVFKTIGISKDVFLKTIQVTNTNQFTSDFEIIDNEDIVEVQSINDEINQIKPNETIPSVNYNTIPQSLSANKSTIVSNEDTSHQVKYNQNASKLRTMDLSNETIPSVNYNTIPQSLSANKSTIVLDNSEDVWGCMDLGLGDSIGHPIRTNVSTSLELNQQSNKHFAPSNIDTLLDETSEW